MHKKIDLWEIQNERGETICQEYNRDAVIAGAWEYYDIRHSEDAEPDCPDWTPEWSEEVKLIGYDDDGAEAHEEHITLEGDCEPEASDFEQHNVWNKAQAGVK